jgi:predicted O-linked N-acetylglucosamine transferase (SPINDLY family)
VGADQPFYLAYQGFNDRDLQSRYGSLICRIMSHAYPSAALRDPAPAGERVRVGIVSGFFRRHANWNVPIKGWLGQLDRRRFQVFGYWTGVLEDTETIAAADLCDRFRRAPMSMDAWRQTILADAPDVLIYPEVGMDAVTLQLAAQRLAPVQCTSWGHPDSSGLPTMDYFLSSDLMEPGEGDDHYTEKLVRLPNLSIYYEPVEVQEVPLARPDLGLRPTATVFWCGQSLFKYLPQYDEAFTRIARQAGDCQFAFIQHPHGAVTDFFRKRLELAFASQGLNPAEHCIFWSRLDQKMFSAAVGQCDIILDSIGWSGCNTTLESLPHGLPVVTLPGKLMRGRHTMAILKMMGVTETIAATVDDYVATAVRLGKDLPWRKAIAAKMAANRDRVYRDRSCIEALQDFLEDVGRQRPSPT